MELKDVSPEQLAKIQALSQYQDMSLTPEEEAELKQLQPRTIQQGDNEVQISPLGQKKEQFDYLSQKQRDNPMRQRIMKERYLRSLETNPEHLDDLYNMMLRNQAGK